MKKLILSVAVLAAFATNATAQTAAPAPAAAPEASPFTGNLAVASDYRFRGISQTFKQPTVQGGFDYAHSSGIYLGNWNSNVSGIQYLNGGGLEMDFYGGVKFEPVKGLGLDIGALYYYYPGSSITVGTTDVKYNNAEVYFGASYKWFSLKYNHGVTDFFGLKASTAPSYAATALTANGSSKNSGYLDFNVNVEIADKTMLSLHAGRQTVKNYNVLSYSDYKIGISRDFGFATIGLAGVSTNANKNYWKATNGASTPAIKELGTSTAVLTISKTF